MTEKAILGGRENEGERERERERERGGAELGHREKGSEKNNNN